MKFLEKGEDVFIGSDIPVKIKYPDLVRIGSHVAIDDGVIISTKADIGDYIHIAPYVVVIGGAKSKLILEDFSFIASGTKVVCGSEDYTGGGLVSPVVPEEFRKITYGQVLFEKYSGCGVNSSILPNVKMSKGSVLGANSLLTKDTEPWGIYVGSPAKLVGYRDSTKIEEYVKILGYNF